MARSLRRARNPRSRGARDAICSRGCPTAIAHAMSAPGWAKHLAGVDPQCGRPVARGAREAAAAAQVRRCSACRRRRRRSAASTSRAPGKAQAAVHVAGADLRAGGRAAGFLGRGARAVRRRLPRGRHRAQLLLLSPHARRASSWKSGAHALGCAVIPGGIGNTERSSTRSRISSRPAMSARRIS